MTTRHIIITCFLTISLFLSCCSKVPPKVIKEKEYNSLPIIVLRHDRSTILVKDVIKATYDPEQGTLKAYFIDGVDTMGRPKMSTFEYPAELVVLSTPKGECYILDNILTCP